MFDPAAVLSTEFVDHILETFQKSFPDQNPRYSDCLEHSANEVVKLLKSTSAPYHNAEHTMIVTLVGQQIIKGQTEQIAVGAEDWLHFILSLLTHDVGYVRGACRGDTLREAVINDAGDRVCPPRGATDAYLTPYHVDRGQIFAREYFSQFGFIDVDRIIKSIEYTRFPVPDEPYYARVENEHALVRSADLIGQIADPYYLSKLTDLYQEFLETGLASELGYGSAADLLDQFPDFFHQQVEPLIGPAVSYLERTSDGRDIVAQLKKRLSEAARH